MFLLRDLLRWLPGELFLAHFDGEDVALMWESRGDKGEKGKKSTRSYYVWESVTCGSKKTSKEIPVGKTNWHLHPTYNVIELARRQGRSSRKQHLAGLSPLGCLSNCCTDAGRNSLRSLGRDPSGSRGVKSIHFLLSTWSLISEGLVAWWLDGLMA